MNTLQRQLFDLQDLKYREFHSKLMPGIAKETIIGIRTPVLRNFVKEFRKTDEAKIFLAELPHQYYEENNIHMMLIAQIRDYETCIAEVNRFLPYINNWATCDLPHKWIASNETYTIRYGIGTLMRFYLDDDFDPSYVTLVAQVWSEEYYVNMMIAWYLATALAKQWESVIPYLEQRKLPEWVHRKTIQKAVESYRITPEQKVYLKSLR